MSQRTLDAHYSPNWRLTQAHGLMAYNCGYAEYPGCGSFDHHQQMLVWQLLGDTEIRPDAIVLDIGCGIGGPSRWIHQRHHPRMTLGLEYLGASVRAAERSWNGETVRPRFVQGDAHHLPLGDASVDIIFNLESALHYADKNAFLTECQRVLKGHGTLCLGDITSSRKGLFAPMRLLNRVPSQFNSNLHLWALDDYMAAFRRHGFEVVHHEDASRKIAIALADGLAEVRKRGWRACKGFRGRTALLAVMERLFRKGRLSYDLFRVRQVSNERK